MKLLVIGTAAVMTCLSDGTGLNHIQEPIEPILLNTETQQWEEAVSLGKYVKEYKAQMLFIQNLIMIMDENKQQILRKEVKVPVDPDVRKIIYRRARDGF